MEFYVVDPKNQEYDSWVKKVRTFLTKSKLDYQENTGELYYVGDDVATPGAKSLFCFQSTAKKVVWSRFETMTIVSMSFWMT